MAKVSVVLRAAFGYDTEAASLESGVACDPDEGLTQQQFAEEVDINTIVKRFGITGQLPENLRMPVSGDFTDISDFQSAMNAVVAAKGEFMRLPGELRQRFNHDPAQLISFLEDDKNKDEAIKLGLVNKPPEKTRDVVQAVDELAAKLVPKGA